MTRNVPVHAQQSCCIGAKTCCNYELIADADGRCTHITGGCRVWSTKGCQAEAGCEKSWRRRSCDWVKLLRGVVRHHDDCESVSNEVALSAPFHKTPHSEAHKRLTTRPPAVTQVPTRHFPSCRARRASQLRTWCRGTDWSAGPCRSERPGHPSSGRWPRVLPPTHQSARPLARRPSLEPP